MTRTQYVVRYALNLLAELAVWASFGALGWTAVADAETFVALLERRHYALALLIVIGILAYVALTTIAIPTLRSSRYWMRNKRETHIAINARAQARNRLRLLVQEPINSNEDARAILKRTQPSRWAP